jgi:hypothetical protein
MHAAPVDVPDETDPALRITPPSDEARLYARTVTERRRRVTPGPYLPGMSTKKIRPAPLPRSWWVDDHLMGGAYPGSRDPAEAAEKVEALVAAGVTLFLDLTTEADRLEPYDQLVGAIERDPHVRRVRLPVTDLHAPSTGQVKEALTLIDAEAAAGGVTYVHCWGGIGRTGSIVGCHLARRIGGPAALDRLRELRVGSADSRRIAPETQEQQALVRGWA